MLYRREEEEEEEEEEEKEKDSTEIISIYSLACIFCYQSYLHIRI